MWERIYLIITGAGTARRTPELADALASLGTPVLCVPTEHAARVVSLHELWQALPRAGGHGVIDSYFDDGLGMPAAPGLVLVAPCDFNSLNKMAHGIADSLALSIAADAIGAGWPVLASISMNRGLWQHPRTQASVRDLTSWGVEFVAPVMADGVPRLSETDALVDAVRRRLV